MIAPSFPFGDRFRSERVDLPGGSRMVLNPRPVVLGPARYDRDHPDAPLGFPPFGLRSDEFTPEELRALRSFPILCLTSGPEPAPPPIWGMTVTGGARELIDRFLPRGCDEHSALLTGAEVVALQADERGWRVRVRECGGPESGDRPVRTERADAVLLTQPVPEVRALLDASDVVAPHTLAEELRSIRYERALTVYVVSPGASNMPGGVISLSDSPLSMVFENRPSCPLPTGSAVTALTAVVNPDWAAAHWDESDEEIARRLLPIVASWAGGELVWHRVRRWPHGRALGRVRMPFAEVTDAPPLVIAGEAFAGYVSNPLDAAYTSATHSVTHLCRALGRVARAAGRRTPRTPTSTVVEVAVSSAAEATLAIKNGADRLLLLAAPEVGGLTPSLDTFLAVRRAADAGAEPGQRIPVTVMLRPRLGDCVYDRDEVAQLERDARRFLLVGADGIAFGALTLRGAETRVDANACRALVELARGRGKEAVFHRAFDAVRDRRTGLQDLIALKFDRVITAGRWKLAADSVSDLAMDVAYAGWDIDVVVAGGIGAEVAGYVVTETGCPGVLLGLHRPSSGRIAIAGSAFTGYRHTPPDGARVAATVTALRTAERGDSPDGDCLDANELEATCVSDER